MRQSRSSRREFLQGRSLVRAVRDSLSGPLAGGEDVLSERRQQDRQAHYLERYARNAMACEFELMFNLHQYRQAGAAALLAFEQIVQLESQLTIYRDDSEVSLLNQRAVVEPQSVETGLFGLLQLAVELSELTAGAFDITAGPLGRLWGFDRRQGTLPDPAAIDRVRQQVGYPLLELDEESQQLAIGHPEASIDLGGIGKGYALDRVAETLENRGIGDWILHGGQSSVIARGNCQRADGTADGWAVGLTHPILPGTRLAEVVLRDRSLGTSGTARQGFFHNGVRYGHIIDPRTGWPSQHCLSATVIGTSAAVTDALATAFFVMTVEEVEAVCRKLPDVAAILVLPGSGEGAVELVWFNLADQDWTRF